MNAPSTLLLLAGAGLLGSSCVGDGAPAGVDPEAAGPAFRPAAEGVLRAQLASGLVGELGADGLRASQGGRSLQLRTAAYGDRVLAPSAPVVGGCAPLPPGADAGCAPTARLAHDGLVEWWAATPGGLRQGWTLDRPAPGGGDTLIHVSAPAGAVRGVDPDGLGATLRGADGSAWRNAGLQAWDALGERVAARIERAGGGLRIRVDAAGATWPVTVDPLLYQDTLLLASDGRRSDHFGEAVANAGDVNGDGFDDLIVGAPGVDGGGTDRGAAYVYLGSATGLVTGSEVRLDAPLTMDGVGGGSAVAGAGDLNGDGFADVVVGAPTSSSGWVFVYYGSATGIAGASPTTLFGLQLDDLDSEYFGITLSAGGDLNGDGYGDLLIGSLADEIGTQSGGAYIYYGAATGLITEEREKFTASDTASGDAFALVAGGGDLNGDGFGDVVVGAPRAHGAGRAYVYYGAATGLALATEVVLAPSDGASGDEFGISASIAGDLDGDGYDDIVVGSRLHDAGAAYAWYGSATGVVLSSEQQFEPADAADGDEVGLSLTHAGDVDADGYDDLLVGAPEDAAGGAAYLVLGSATGLRVAEGAQLVVDPSAADDDLGVSVALGDFNGDGSATPVIGARYDDTTAGGAGAVHLLDAPCSDRDGDGWCDADDCDPDDGATFHGSAELDSPAGCMRDADGDGYGDADATGVVSPGRDCDDDEADTNPGADEVIGDGVDQDCDGLEICYADGDGDGVRSSETVVSEDEDCTDAGEAWTSTRRGDCDDDDPEIAPGLDDTCGDGVDSDCDGEGGPEDDEDGDGLSNALEAEYGTDGCDDDSDGDGLTDDDEIDWHGTDPADPDTDGDGVSDGDEIDQGTDPLTAPAPVDDGDGDGGGKDGGCSAVGGRGAAPALPLALLTGLAVLRRRRAGPRGG